MEKGLLPRLEELSSMETDKKALDNANNCQYQIQAFSDSELEI
jgi:hypothetical protein